MCSALRSETTNMAGWDHLDVEIWSLLNGEGLLLRGKRLRGLSRVSAFMQNLAGSDRSVRHNRTPNHPAPLHAANAVIAPAQDAIVPELGFTFGTRSSKAGLDETKALISGAEPFAYLPNGRIGRPV